MSENEKLVEKNLSLQQEMNALQTRYRMTEASLKVILLDSLKYRHLTQKTQDTHFLEQNYLCTKFEWTKIEEA